MKMPGDARKWTEISLFCLAFVLATPAMIGVLDAWRVALGMTPLTAWTGDRSLAAWVCAFAAWIVAVLGAVARPRK